MATERSVMVRLRANADQFNREMMKARGAVAGVRDEIDTTNDRTAWLAQGFLALAPSLVPLGAAAVPILAGISAQATVAGGAVATMVLAFNGVGDALKALNAYQLEPTAENLQKLHEAMRVLGPDGADFVRFLDDAADKLSILQMDARAGMFPGMTEGITEALGLLPLLRNVVQEIASGLGELSIDAGKGLAGDEFRGFFRYLQTDAKPLLVEMGHTVGNFISGFAAMMSSFGPLTRDFSGGLLDMSRSFNEWAHGLEGSTSFQEFVQYVRDSGPQALDLLGSIAEAFVQLVEAAAPIGSAALPVLTKFFEILGAIADTPVGSLLILTSALTSMYGRVRALQTITTGGVVGKMTQGFRDSATAAKVAMPTLRQFGNTLLHSVHSQQQLNTYFADGAKKAEESRDAVSKWARAVAPAAISGGLLALSMTGIADGAGLGNTALGASVGLMTTGGPWGAAIGAAIGLATDFAAANQDIESAVKRANAAMDSGSIRAMKASLEELQGQMDDQQHVTGFTDALQHGVQALGVAFNSIDMLWGGDSGTKQLDERADAYRQLQSDIEFAQYTNGKGWKTDGLELFYQALGMTADEASRAARGIDEFRFATERAMGILDQQAAFDAFQASIDAATKSIKDNGETLDNHTEKGRNNRAALRDIASTALKAADGLKGMQRGNYLEGAADRFVEVAKKMGMSEDAAKRLAARLFDLDKLKPKPQVDVDDTKARAKVKGILRDLGYLDHSTGNPQADLLIQQFLKGKLTVQQMMKVLDALNAKPDVHLDTNAAVADARNLQSEIDRLHGKTIVISVHTQRTGNDTAGGPAPLGPTGADGATVPKTGLPYADRHWYLLADGERVTSNRYGQVDRSVKLLDAINAGILNDRIMGLAGGGTAGSSYRGSTPATRGGDNPAERESRRTGEALKGLRGELKKATAALEKERKQRDALMDKMKTVAGDVSGGLRTDLFGETDVWSAYGGSSPEGVMSQLRGDTQSARVMLAAIRELKSKGLHGNALAEVLQQGGLAGAQAFAELSRSELREYAQLYNQRARLTRAAGEAAGGAAYGAALRESRHEYRELRQEVVRLRHAVEKNGRHDRQDHKANRDQQRRGSRNAARNRRHD